MAEATSFTSVAGQEIEQLTWRPEGEPWGVVQLVHGMSEHMARYEDTARRLNQAGLLVVGHTHLGHGAKARRLGYFADENGWDALVGDVHALRLQTQQNDPGLPYFLLGHSMGSFVVRTYCLRHEAGLAGVILSGTGHFAPAVLNLGLLIANLQCAVGGRQKPSHLLEKISTAGHNREWGQRTPFEWLSKDEQVVDAYMADPYCGFTFTAGAYRDLFTGLKGLEPACLTSMEKDVPVLLLSGTKDPVGGRGEGVQTTARELKAAGVRDVTVKLYPEGRHEMFNEPEKEQVWDDLVAWLEAKK